MAWVASPGSVQATTKGLEQIFTPDVQPAGQVSLSFQAQSKHVADPYELPKPTQLVSTALTCGMPLPEASGATR